MRYRKWSEKQSDRTVQDLRRVNRSRDLLLRLQGSQRLASCHSSNVIMEPAAQTATNTAALDRETFPRRALKVTPRGAASHFVGSSIVILSSFAVFTLAMNCGKQIQESKTNKPNIAVVEWWICVCWTRQVNKCLFFFLEIWSIGFLHQIVSC